MGLWVGGREGVGLVGDWCWGSKVEGRDCGGGSEWRWWITTRELTIKEGGNGKEFSRQSK